LARFFNPYWRAARKHVAGFFAHDTDGRGSSRMKPEKIGVNPLYQRQWRMAYVV
jgi:hypothetical protein